MCDPSLAFLTPCSPRLPRPLPPPPARPTPEQGLSVAVIEGHDIGGTCVNRGCVPSKALLAASNEVRKLRNDHHQKTLGIQLNGVATFDRQSIANHATNLATTVQGNLQRSLESIGVVSPRCSRSAGEPASQPGVPGAAACLPACLPACRSAAVSGSQPTLPTSAPLAPAAQQTLLKGQAKLAGPHTVTYGLPGRIDVGGSATARDIIIATGSVPFVPGGIEVDGKTVFTSDHALKMEWLPNWIAIIGSGYIGLEFSDVYTALGCEVGGWAGGREWAGGWEGGRGHQWVGGRVGARAWSKGMLQAGQQEVVAMHRARQGSAVQCRAG